MKIILHGERRSQLSGCSCKLLKNGFGEAGTACLPQVWKLHSGLSTRWLYAVARP